MTKGTILRTIAFVVTSLNNWFAQMGDIDLGNDKANFIYKCISMLVNLASGVVSLWYNNDFTPEACKGTAYTRHLKEVKKDDYVGEDFTKEA